MTRPKPLAALLLASATLLAFTGCRTTVVQPVQPAAAQPAPQPPPRYDDHHDDHHPPPPPPPDHRDDHR